MTFSIADSGQFRDDQTEGIVLADIIQHNGQLAKYRQAGLVGDHFNHAIHRVVWVGIEAVAAKGLLHDPPALRTELSRLGKWDADLATFIYTTLRGLGVPIQREPNLSANVRRLDQLDRCRQAVWLIGADLKNLADHPEAIDSDVLPQLKRAQETDLAPRIAGPSPFKTAPELIATAPATVPWIVFPYVAEHGITELTGKAKAAGKTSLLLHVVGCVAEGQGFLGQPTRHGPVVYLTEEASTTFRASLRRAGVDESEGLHLLSFWDVAAMGWPAIVDLAERKIRELGAALLVIDTLPQFAGLRGDSENNAGDALAALQPLQRLAAKLPVGIVVVRHERKGGGEVGEAGRGSSAFAGAVDIVLSLRRPDGQGRPSIRVIHGLSRFPDTPDTQVIERIHAAASNEQVLAESVCTYVSLGSEADVATQEAEGALRACLPDEEGAALQETEILEQTPGLKRTTLQTAIKKLRGSGEIRRIGGGKKGDPYRYCRSRPAQIVPAETSPIRAAETNLHQAGGRS